MSIEENKAVAYRVWEEIFNQGDMAAIDKYFAPDYVEHFPIPGFPQDLAGLKQAISMLRGAFPDLHYTVDDVIAEGDRVVMRITGRGTQKGPYFNIPATGKQATWTEIHIARMVNGKAVEHWSEANQMGMLQQLGAIPTPGQAQRKAA